VSFVCIYSVVSSDTKRGVLGFVFCTFPFGSYFSSPVKVDISAIIIYLFLSVSIFIMIFN
jgi:hypothetical protein